MIISETQFMAHNLWHIVAVYVMCSSDFDL